MDISEQDIIDAGKTDEAEEAAGEEDEAEKQEEAAANDENAKKNAGETEEYYQQSISQCFRDEAKDKELTMQQFIEQWMSRKGIQGAKRSYMRTRLQKAWAVNKTQIDLFNAYCKYISAKNGIEFDMFADDVQYDQERTFESNIRNGMSDADLAKLLEDTRAAIRDKTPIPSADSFTTNKAMQDMQKQVVELLNKYVELTEKLAGLTERILNAPETTQANRAAAEAANTGMATWKKVLAGLGFGAGALVTGSAITISLLNIRALGSTCQIMGPVTGGTLQTFSCADIKSFQDMDKVDKLAAACKCADPNIGCADTSNSCLQNCSSGPCKCQTLTVDQSKNPPVATDVQGCEGTGFPFDTCTLPNGTGFSSTWLCPQHDPTNPDPLKGKEHSYYYSFHYLNTGEILGKWLTGLASTINQDVSGASSLITWLLKNAKTIILVFFAIFAISTLAKFMGK